MAARGICHTCEAANPFPAAFGPRDSPTGRCASKTSVCINPIHDIHDDNSLIFA
jgi:hypothetical protein